MRVVVFCGDINKKSYVIDRLIEGGGEEEMVMGFGPNWNARGLWEETQGGGGGKKKKKS